MFTQTDIIKEMRETPISGIESAVIAGNVTATKSATENQTEHETIIDVSQGMFEEQKIVNIAFERQRKHNKTPNDALKVEDSESTISPHLIERC